MTNIWKEIGINMRLGELMEQREMSQKELARRVTRRLEALPSNHAIFKSINPERETPLSISQPQISRRKKGDVGAYELFLWKLIAEELGVSLNDLIG